MAKIIILSLNVQLLYSKNIHEVQGDNTSLQHIGLLNLAYAHWL